MVDKLTKEELAEQIKKLNAIKRELEKKVKFELKVITPTLASQWIKKNRKNRKALSTTRVYSYAKQMLDGVWGFSGQPIIFSDTDMLLDGGGRLTAITLAHRPILSTVIYGIPEEAFVVMDAIKSRTFKDVLEASQLLEGETNTVIGYVASMAKRIMEWSNERYGSHGAATTRISSNNIECLNFVEENLAQLRECAKACAEMRGAHREKLMSKKDYIGSFMGYLTIIKGWDFTDVYKFFDELTNVHSTVRAEGNPIAMLRTYLFMSYGHERPLHITDEERFHMFSRSWNEYCFGNEVKRFNLKKCKDVPMGKCEFAEKKAV